MCNKRRYIHPSEIPENFEEVELVAAGFCIDFQARDLLMRRRDSERKELLEKVIGTLDGTNYIDPKILPCKKHGTLPMLFNTPAAPYGETQVEAKHVLVCLACQDERKASTVIEAVCKWNTEQRTEVV